MLRDDLEEEDEDTPVRVDIGYSDDELHDGFHDDDRAGLIAPDSSGGGGSCSAGMPRPTGPYDYPNHPAEDDLACVPELPCGSYTKMGKLYVCVAERDVGTGIAEPTWVAGPCWPMFCFTQCLILGISGLAMWAYLPYVHWVFAVAGVPLVLFVAFALFKTGCSNPGVLKRRAEPPEGETGWRWNDQSQSYYPPGATYCRESQVLVHDYDHFCPWTGTTIAGGNMRYFTIFVSSLSFLCFYVIFLAVIGGAAVSASVSRTPAAP